MNFSFPHVPFSRLVDLIEDRLTPDEQAQLQAHLAGCAHCSAEAAQLQRLIGLMRADSSEDAPAHVMTRAVQLFQPHTLPTSDLPQRLLAVLRFDSIGLAPAFGVRSGEPRARQLLFNAETHEIDLRIEPAGAAWIISGQVLGGPSAGGRIELQDATGAMHASLNAQSEFSLSPVAAGRYKLILHLAHVDVEVDELRIG